LLKEGALMGYVDALAQDITEATQLQFPRPGSLASALMPATLEARSMPMAWRTGQELDVQVRVRPIVRSRSGRGRAKGGKEVDAFVLTQPSNENPGDASGRSIAARETAYADWLGHQMSREGACELVIAQMVAFKRTRLLTRPKVEEKRTSAVSEGPDATMHARLRIKDPDTFVALLKRGIGRHRGFGFGMMLLAPPGRILKT
jgi:CRISPR system Cascade subunit CasE